MKIVQLLQSNITTLFAGPIDHGRFNVESIKKDLSLSDQINLLEAPNLKVITDQANMLEVAIEQSRIIVIDTSGKEIKSSDLPNKIQPLLSGVTADLNAYGFNFNLVAQDTNNIDYKKFVSNKVLEVFGEIKKSGFMIQFSEDNIDITVQISPTLVGNSVAINANANFSAEVLPDVNHLKKELVNVYKLLEEKVVKL